MSFEPNRGQTAATVKFLSRGPGYNLFLTSGEAVLGLHRQPNRKPGPAAAVRLKLVGANPGAGVAGLEPQAGKSNYFIGKDPANWRTNVPHYGRVRYDDVYPGIDLVYYGNHGQLEYDFVVSPGAHPGQIRVRVTGVDRLRLDQQGDLVADRGDDAVRFRRPIAYQTAGQILRPIASHYVLADDRSIGFQVEDYDATQTLIIDPIIEYATYLSGNSEGGDRVFALAVDASRHTYVTGITHSPDFPVTGGAFDTAFGSTQSSGTYSDAFVTKLSPDGTSIIYSTYLGGDFDSSHPTESAGLAIAVDTAGHAYVAGDTNSDDFPTTTNALDTTHNSPNTGMRDAFVTKLSGDGSALIYSTFLGSGGIDVARGIAVDPSGHAYITGAVNALSAPNPAFPTTAEAVDSTFAGFAEVFVSKLTPDGSNLEYSTLLGGNADEEGHAIAVDASGHAYVTGFTSGADFPTTPGAFDTSFNGDADAFVAKLNPMGTSLVYSAFLGGSNQDEGNGIAVGPTGNAYVAGRTRSPDFRTKAGSFDESYGGGLSDGFIVRINQAGSGRVFSTFLGGTGSDEVAAVALDSSGNVYVTGSSSSADFPLVGAIDSNSSLRVFVTRMDARGSVVTFSTFVGGSTGDQTSHGIALDLRRDIYVAGETTSPNFPITPGAADSTFNTRVPDGAGNGINGFVLKIRMD